MRTISLQQARRLALLRQQLAGPRLAPDRERMRQVLRAIRVLQLDPIRAVERTQRLVLFSRLGLYDVADLTALRGEERFLFEYWAHAASLVLTDDLPIFLSHMHHMRRAGWKERTRTWLQAHQHVRDHVRRRLAADGPLPSSAIEDVDDDPRQPSRWSNNRKVARMLDCMWWEGEVLVAGRQKNSRVWGLAEKVLPQIATMEPPDREEAAEAALVRAVRALGVATPRHIREHFARKTFWREERRAIQRLADAGEIHPLRVDGLDTPGQEPWYVHREELPLLASDALTRGWQPRTTLLSPFDNLICDRARTELLFDFHYRIEIYVPRSKRQYGYYVLPILHGERLIGRIDPTMDRKTGRFHVHNLYPEPDTGADSATVAAVAAAIDELASFLGAGAVVYENLPAGWEALPRQTPRAA